MRRGRPPDDDPEPPDFFWKECVLTIRGAVTVRSHEEDKIDVIRRIEPLLKELGFVLEYVDAGNIRPRAISELPRATFAELTQAVRSNPGLTAAELGRIVYATKPWSEALDRIATQRIRVLIARSIKDYDILRKYSPNDGGRDAVFFVRNDKRALEYFATPADARTAARAEKIAAVNAPEKTLATRLPRDNVTP